ncbi:MAG: S9 family peptidase [Chloroflexota bacterium]
MSKPIGPDVAYRLKTISDPALSPDGARLAYSYSWTGPAPGDALCRIMMLDLATLQPKEFTQGREDTAPKFAPDGATLAFLRRDEQGRRQVWLIGANGGEARKLTSAPRGVFDVAWSPDSRRVVYAADVGGDAPSEDPNAEDAKANRGPEVKVVRRIRFQYDTLGWRGDAHVHLFVAQVDGAPAKQITDGDWDDVAPTWSPDGSRIAFISERRDDRDVRRLSEVYVVPAAGGAPEMWSQGLFSAGAVAWSPDSRKLVVIGSEAPEGMVLWQGWLFILEPGGPARRITDDSLRPYLGFPMVTRPPELRWTEHGQILFLGERRGESFFFAVPAAGGMVRELTGGGCQSSGLTVDRGAEAAAMLSSSPNSPGDLYYVDLVSTASERLTDTNREYLAEHVPARMEKFRIQREDLEVECRLFFPPDFDPARRYPLVLDIHGGPNGAFYDSFVPLQQVLATSGHLVLAVNPRGSSTYGDGFMMAVIKDWGGEDYLDLMAAVDEVCGRPYVDRGRLGVHGYSYGGYMASWTVGHTNRFRAAVVGAPCIDLFSAYGTSDIGVSFGEVQWGGSLVEAATELIKRSPITYASEVNTPVLLLHGEADARCPIGQSEEYFVVLKRLGKEVEFVRFPGCSHSFVRTGHPKMREEYLARTLGWFQRWL